MRALSYVIPETLGERAIDALTMLVKGMLMIFLVLAILMVVLLIMERFFASSKQPKPEKKEEVKAAPAPVAPAPVAQDNGALVAAITAAIAAVKALGRVDTLILGGFDRGIDYTPLVDFLKENSIQNLVFVGAAGRGFPY